MKFIKFNNNPKNNITKDCVIRAISFATNKSWKDTYRELTELGIKKGLILNDRKNWKAYLKKLGYEIQKMPVRDDRTRYTLEEFCDELAKPNIIYIVKVANHITVVKNKDLYDTWNCSNKSVGNYWIIGEIKEYDY